MYSILERMCHRIAALLALLGGAVLFGIIILTCISITGRFFVPFDIGLGPIRGIYDITEIAMAAAIFAFLPWTHMNGSHARVDLFAGAIPKMVNNLLNLLFDVAMFLAAFYGTWRLYLGMRDKLSFGETTLIAQIPVWTGYAASLVGAVGFVLIAAFCILRSLRHLTGHQA